MKEKTYSINLLSQKIYWLNKLSGELPETNLLLDYLRPLNFFPKDNDLSFNLSHDLSQAIIKLAQGSYFSTYWILLSALNVLLQKYTRNNDIIVGIPIYEGIDHNCVHSCVLPLRTQVKPQLSFKDFLFQVKDAIIGAYNNQTYNFDELIQLLGISTSPNRSPFFDIVVLLENIHDKSSFERLNNDITISFLLQNEIIVGKIEYKSSLFDSKTIELIGKYYISVVESLIKNIEIKISEIIFLKNRDKHQLLKNFNNNTKKYPIEQTIDRLFERQVLHTPDNIAVVHQGKILTYQQLNQKANQLARLLRKLGVAKGEFVGILKDRDLNFLIAILATYKAGGAYVPIDSTYPLDRIEYMLSNSEVKYLFTDFLLLNTLEEVVPNCQQLSVICLDDVISEPQLKSDLIGLKLYQKSDFSQFSAQNLELINDANDPAYMLYTSGSTGLPKGAIVRHDGAINHIYAQYDELELNEEFTFLQSAPSSTDISVWQFLAPLLIGGKTVIVDLETVAIAEKLFNVLRAEKITVVELVPALFGGLLEYASQLPIHERKLPDLKWMMVVGEPVSVSRVNKWLEIYPYIKIANAYGPTEAADDITQFIIDKPLPENQRTVPIGKPLANLNLYILDEEIQLLPIGAPGEICVSGIGVGDGYWKNKAKTQFSFVPNPFISKLLSDQNHDVIYKTGDLGRWLSDGNIEFLGRIDNQVKIRGFRIELGEIEAALRQHSAVQETVVVVREDDPNDKCLVAYFVARTSLETEGLIEQLRSLLKEKLPQHMIPADFVWLEKIPLAPSGKVDQKALPAPDRSEHQLKFVAPRNPTEEIVADIWCQILKREKIGIYDDFFDLGGHSLLATQVISRLREAFKIELPLRSLFEMPTVAGIVEYIEQIKTVQQLQSVSPNSIELTADREEIEI
jgi:amino acid adenylation domain-containing protein